ncbi:MAG: YeeE/YedE thiosulfate transporter family protein [Gemmatimonadaceae bacterium]|nr:YeeE/YedE thiosulfate transporter family protein [Gemmatimonadaceae bacterium]
MTLLYGLLVGVAMGAFIQRVGASSPAVILRNLRLKDLSVIKFMATTIAISSILSYVLQAGGAAMHFDIKPTYVLGVALGGAIFGVGFALGGYCPGTCVVGIGEGRKDAWAAIAGGVLGAFVFTLVWPIVEPLLIKPLNFGKITIAELLGANPLMVAAVLAVVFLTVVTLLPTRPGRTPTT